MKTIPYVAALFQRFQSCSGASSPIEHIRRCLRRAETGSAKDACKEILKGRIEKGREDDA